MAGYPMQYETKTIQEDLFYKGELMLNYVINYPQFSSNQFPGAIGAMNQYYYMRALELKRYYRNNLYNQAVEQFRFAQQNGYPFNMFGAQTAFTVTYNQNCYVSLYTDQYEYTGGAHGITTRVADTWDLRKGYRIQLSQLFPGGFDYAAYLTDAIIAQIRQQIESGEADYFENYQELAVEYFNPGNFYLTPQGLVIYYDLYAIAPYAAGIREFTIPYSDVVLQPSCA